VGKVEISSVEVPTAPTLVAQPEGKAPDDNPYDDGPILLNFVVDVFWIASHWRSYLLQMNQPNLEKLDVQVYQAGVPSFCAS
jgi:hypothetical protein